VNKKQFTTLAIAVLLISLVWIILTPILFNSTQAASDISAPQSGFVAPDFTLSTPQGQTHTLSEYRDKTVLVFFWASWCSVCKGIMPDLQAVYESVPTEAFEILAVNTTHQDTITNAVNYFQSQGYTYPMLLDTDGSVSRLYQLNGLPTSIMVGPDGLIRDRVIGSSMSEGYLRAFLNDLLTDMD
jgi:peroxiredoxin